MYIDQKIRFDLIKSALTTVGGNEKGKVLEVGCGGGALATMLTELGYDVFASDMPGLYLPQAPKVFFADGRFLPVGSEQFDYTVSSEVLEHVPPAGRQQFMEELFRVTRPQGRIILTAFVRRTLTFRLWGAAWLLANRKGSLPQWYCEHVMLPPPTTDEIKDAFSSMSGKVLFSFEYLGPIGLWLTWIQNATGWMGITKLANLLGPLVHVGGKVSCVVAVEKPGVA